MSDVTPRTGSLHYVEGAFWQWTSYRKPPLALHYVLIIPGKFWGQARAFLTVTVTETVTVTVTAHDHELQAESWWKTQVRRGECPRPRNPSSVSVTVTVRENHRILPEVIMISEPNQLNCVGRFPGMMRLRGGSLHALYFGQPSGGQGEANDQPHR